MDTLNLSLAINALLAAAALLFLFRLVGGARRMRELSLDVRMRRGGRSFLIPCDMNGRSTRDLRQIRSC